MESTGSSISAGPDAAQRVAARGAGRARLEADPAADVERGPFRAAGKGDLVEIDFVTRIDGAKVEGGESTNYPFVLGESTFVPGFDEAVAGMQKEEEKTVTLPFPKDWPTKQLAGKVADFTITLRNVLERIVPDADDAFAQSLGNFENLGALKKSIREGLELEREMEEKQRVRQEAVKQLGKRIKVKDVPDIVLEQELGRMKEEFRARIENHGMPFEKYLDQIGKKEEELRTASGRR